MRLVFIPLLASLCFIAPASMAASTDAQKQEQQQEKIKSMKAQREAWAQKYKDNKAATPAATLARPGSQGANYKSASTHKNDHTPIPPKYPRGSNPSLAGKDVKK